MNVVFVGEGRLGNQVFQYAAIRKLFGASAVVWSPSLGGIQKVFEDDERLNVVLAGRYCEAAIRRVVVPALLRPLFRQARLGAYCIEPYGEFASGFRGESGRAEIQPGIFSGLAFVDGGYYQNLSDLLVPRDFQGLNVRPEILAGARKVVRDRHAAPSTPSIVMHVRRRDYVGFSSFGISDVVLPPTYYVKAAELARKKCGEGSEILIVSDDPAWCDRELKALRPFSTGYSSQAIDFALLSLFPIVVISNSTFSLAAACVGKAVESVIAPRYWFGHEVEAWYPPRIAAQDSRFTYI